MRGNWAEVSRRVSLSQIRHNVGNFADYLWELPYAILTNGLSFSSGRDTVLFTQLYVFASECPFVFGVVLSFCLALSHLLYVMEVMQICLLLDHRWHSTSFRIALHILATQTAGSSTHPPL